MLFQLFRHLLLILPLFLSIYAPFTLANKYLNDLTNVVIGTGEWEPYHSKKLKHYGVGSHIVKEVFAAVGVQTEFQHYRWKRGLAESADGKIDGIATWGGYESWIDHHYGSDPIFTGAFVLWMRKDNLVDWRNMENLKGLKLGVLHSEKSHFHIQQAIKKGYLTVDTTKSIAQNIEKLVLGRIDLISLNYDVGMKVSNNILSEEERNKIIPHPDPLRISLYRLLLNKKTKKEI